MVLLHAAPRHRTVKRRCTIATFDHRSGPHTSKAARLVRVTARALGLAVVSGRARSRGASEAEWRDMRWRFLRSVAETRGATVVSAHTRDDQIETVVMRILRGAGARGLAALYAQSAVVRPLLAISRRAVEGYARAHSVEWVEDPTNSSRNFLRNRVRHDLLPAIRAVQPNFECEILALSRQAALVRRETERLAQRYVLDSRDQLVLSAAALHALPPSSLAILWPAFVAKLGVPLDRRGVVRATRFSLQSRPGQQAQCGGGVRLERTAKSILVRRDAVTQTPATMELGSAVDFGVWRVRRVSPADFRTHVERTGRTWAAAVHSERLRVRAWQPGDRVRASGQSFPRRVKRYFSELDIPVSERKSWPVVVGEGRVLWVPGICQADPTTERPGHPLTYMICERRAG